MSLALAALDALACLRLLRRSVSTVHTPNAVLARVRFSREQGTAYDWRADIRNAVAQAAGSLHVALQRLDAIQAEVLK